MAEPVNAPLCVSDDSTGLKSIYGKRDLISKWHLRTCIILKKIVFSFFQVGEPGGAHSDHSQDIGLNNDSPQGLSPGDSDMTLSPHSPNNTSSHGQPPNTHVRTQVPENSGFRGRTHSKGWERSVTKLFRKQVKPRCFFRSFRESLPSIFNM